MSTTQARRPSTPTAATAARADPERGAELGWSVAAGERGRFAYEKHAEGDDFGQAGTLYREVMNDTDRDHLVTNNVGHASDAVSDEMQLRVIAYWANVHPQLGARVADGLGHTNGSTDSKAPAHAGEIDVVGEAIH